jgi:sugar fermentation stimulation protein A
MLNFNNITYGTLIKRPSKRIKSPYVGDITLQNGDPTEYLAHCPALGLGEILKPTSEVMISKTLNPKSKTCYVIEAVKENSTWVGNVPLHANRLVKQMLENDSIIPNISYIKPEYVMEDSRIDFYAKDVSGSEYYIEVKSVHIKVNDVAVFPVGYKKKKDDTVSERANKHVKHLTNLATQGKNTMIIFVVQRNDCSHFEPNFDKDRMFCSLLKSAYDSGVVIRALQCSINENGLTFEKEMKTKIS